MIEIRFHGRGGQGAVTSAELLAQAAIQEGKFAQAFPSFGPERRGAPVLAFSRVSDAQIRIRSQINQPDVVLVLDASLLDILDVTEGLRKGGVLVVNSSLPIKELAERFAFEGKLGAVNATDIARKILGVAVDIENINWLIRLRKYYALGMGQMLDWVLPGGSRITKDTVRSFYASDGLTKVVESVALGPYAAIRQMVEENASEIEKFLYEFLFREIKRALSGFPFTIGTVLGYLLLKQNETRNVISLLNAKKLGLSKQELEHLITL